MTGTTERKILSAVVGSIRFPGEIGHSVVRLQLDGHPHQVTIESSEWCLFWKRMGWNFSNGTIEDACKSLVGRTVAVSRDVSKTWRVCL